MKVRYQLRIKKKRLKRAFWALRGAFRGTKDNLRAKYGLQNDIKWHRF
jgi:hypothetical protein